MPYEEVLEKPIILVECSRIDLTYGNTQPAANRRMDLEEVTTWQNFNDLALEALPFVRAKVQWSSRALVAENECEIGDEVKLILQRVTDICKKAGHPGRWRREPNGKNVIGPPDFIWIPQGATCATICLEVKTPWTLSTWSKKTPLDPPFDESLEFKDLVEAVKKYATALDSVEQLSGYMLVSVMSTRVVVLMSFRPFNSANSMRR